MREYKFRGFSVGLRENKWFYGSLVKHRDDWYQIYDGLLWVNVDPESAGQMILKFKDGSEFYEGDIVKCTDDCDFYDPFITYLKWFGGDYSAYDLDYNPDSETNGVWYFINNGDIQVIGNKYENPELLEVRE